MTDVIEETVELLETAYAEQDWALVLEAVHLLNEIPNGNLSCDEDEEDNANNG